MPKISLTNIITDIIKSWESNRGSHWLNFNEKEFEGLRGNVLTQAGSKLLRLLRASSLTEVKYSFPDRVLCFMLSISNIFYPKVSYNLIIDGVQYSSISILDKEKKDQGVYKTEGFELYLDKSTKQLVLGFYSGGEKFIMQDVVIRYNNREEGKLTLSANVVKLSNTNNNYIPLYELFSFSSPLTVLAFRLGKRKLDGLVVADVCPIKGNGLEKGNFPVSYSLSYLASNQKHQQ